MKVPCPLLACRAIAGLACLLVALATPPHAQAAEEIDAYHRPWTPPAPVLTDEAPLRRNQAPKVTAVREEIPLPDEPTAADISASGILASPLRATQSESASGAERAALGEFLQSYRQSGGPLNLENIALLESFAAGKSIGSDADVLLAEAADIANRFGYFAKQGDLLRSAWDVAKQRQGTDGLLQADATLASYLRFLARSGKKQELRQLLQETENRPLSGFAWEARYHAKEALWFLENQAVKNVFCGFNAANDICVPRGKQPIFPDIHDDAEAKRFVERGLSLHELKERSREAGGDLVVVKRVSGSAIPVPSVAHLTYNHYVAFTGRGDSGVVMVDKAMEFSGEVPDAVINAQSSGYFLVPEATDLGADFALVGEAEASVVFGRHCVHGRDTQGTNVTQGNNGSMATADPAPPKQCKIIEKKPSAPAPMAFYEFALLNPGLMVYDTPVFHVPAYGPKVAFTLTYNERTPIVYGLSSVSNLGPTWIHAYLTYIELTSTGINPSLRFVDQSGGYHDYTYSATAGAYQQRYRDMPIPSAMPGGYRLRFADGSSKEFTQANTVGSTTRYYLTAIVDTDGNRLQLAYDNRSRLVSLTDASGLVTTLGYAAHQGDGVPTDEMKIRTVTDPFSRSAHLVYSASGRLKKIIDPIGITSEFTYDTTLPDRMVKLTTPYGTDKFTYGELPGINSEPGRWVQAEDPQGDIERAEANDLTGAAFNFSAEPIPPATINGVSFMPKSDLLQYRNTFYWDKKMWRMAPGNYNKSRIYNFLAINSDTITGVLASRKEPLESRVWFNYPGQTSASAPGNSSQPSKIVRAIEGPTGTQTWTMSQMSYNNLGNVTETSDVEGRTLRKTYATNEIDVLKVEIKDGDNWRTLQTFADYVNNRPGRITDASGLETAVTYNSKGQPLEVSNSRGGNSEKIKFNYGGFGLLQSIERTGPSGGSLVTMASYTYDAANRVRTATDADGYVLTYDYDAIDRVTLITHPDGTTEQFNYDKLDLAAAKTRGGLWTRTFYNSLRQPVAVQDPAGRLTQFEWCKCGALQKLIDALGRPTEWKYDEQGRVYEKIYADGSKALTTYQPLSGRVATTTRPGDTAPTATYSYSLSGQLLTHNFSDPATPDVTLAYEDFAGRLTRMQDGIGTTLYSYVPIDGASPGAGQLASIDGPWANDTLGYSYDWLGRAASTRLLGDDGVQVLWQSAVTRDGLGRLDAVTDDIGTFDYVYDPGNIGRRIDRIVAPHGVTTELGYFPLNAAGAKALALQSITHRVGSTPVSSFIYDYDPQQRITSWVQTQNGVQRTWDLRYDRASQLTGATLRDGAGAITGQWTWAYDPAGNRVADQDGDRALPGYFNNLNQLMRLGGAGQIMLEGTVNEAAKVDVDGAPAQVFSMPGSTGYRFQKLVNVAQGTNTVEIQAVDANGNRTPLESWKFNVGAAEREFTYTPDGATSSDGQRTYTWDAANRMTSLTTGSDTYFWEYDGAGRRVVEKLNGTTTKRWVWNGLSIIQERNANNAVLRSFYGTGIKTASDSIVLIRDHLGSVREAIDSSGVVRARYQYGPWGERSMIGTASFDVPFGFTGHFEHSATGLVFAPYRSYGSDLGRWLSRDPIGEHGGINLYGYVLNNPTVLKDILGQAPVITKLHPGVEVLSPLSDGGGWRVRTAQIGDVLAPSDLVRTDGNGRVTLVDDKRLDGPNGQPKCSNIREIVVPLNSDFPQRGNKPYIPSGIIIRLGNSQTWSQRTRQPDLESGILFLDPSYKDRLSSPISTSITQ